jgi:ornithine cyclodeaminase/alanine dehydrogenase
MTLLLTRSDVDGLVPIADVIDAVEAAHADISSGTARQPAPTTLSLESSSASFLPMAALADRQGLAAVKFLADVPDNPASQLPRQRSVILLLSRDTGACEGIIDGALVTRQRTAAASAVASRCLARPDSSVLGLVGAGNLALEHVGALLAVLPIKRVAVWSRTKETTGRFVDRVRDRYGAIAVDVLPSPREVTAASDVLCTLTPARDPVVLGEWFRPGLHINAVGAPPRPDHREIDSAGMGRAKVFVDSMATAQKKSGDLLLAIADGSMGESDIRAELGDVITGRKAGRTDADDITLFDSVGLAIQDLALGGLLIRAARAKGVGQEIDLSR